MFLASSSRLFRRESSEEEFIRYIQDNGVNTAFQPSLILLFEMPVKPFNLHEFFAEFLENGATMLSRASLLRAELCFKQAEVQDIKQRLQKLDEDLGYMEVTLSRLEERTHILLSSHPEVEEPYDLLSRFLEDLMRYPANKYSPYDTVPLYIEEEKFRAYGAAEGEDTNSCLPYVDSVFTMVEDLKSFDPWGMVFKFRTPKSKAEAQAEARAHQTHLDEMYWSDSEIRIAASTDNLKQLTEEDEIEQGNIMIKLGIEGNSGSEVSYDSGDAATLVELFHERSVILSTEEKFLSVQQADKFKLGDLLGWETPESRKKQGSNIKLAFDSEEIQPSCSERKGNLRDDLPTYHTVDIDQETKTAERFHEAFMFDDIVDSDIDDDDFFSYYNEEALKLKEVMIPKTDTNFVFEFPIQEVKNAQQWIDSQYLKGLEGFGDWRSHDSQSEEFIDDYDGEDNYEITADRRTLCPKVKNRRFGNELLDTAAEPCSAAKAKESVATSSYSVSEGTSDSDVEETGFIDGSNYGKREGTTIVEPQLEGRVVEKREKLPPKKNIMGTFEFAVVHQMQKEFDFKIFYEFGKIENNVGPSKEKSA